MDDDYHLEILCPRCGSTNVAIEQRNGFYYFSNCNNCGYSVKPHEIDRVELPHATKKL